MQCKATNDSLTALHFYYYVSDTLRECRLLLAYKCSRITISIGFCAAQNMRRNTNQH